MPFLQFWDHLRMFCFYLLTYPLKQQCNWRAVHCHIVQFSSIVVSLCCNTDLKILELTHNQIHTLPDDIGALRHLQCLYMRHNKLTNLPLLDNCIALKVSVSAFLSGVTRDGWISASVVKMCLTKFYLFKARCSMLDLSLDNVFIFDMLQSLYDNW